MFNEQSWLTARFLLDKAKLRMFARVKWPKETFKLINKVVEAVGTEDYERSVKFFTYLQI